MTPLSVGAKLWAKTVFVTALLIGTCGILGYDVFEIVTAGILFIAGFIVTLPLLMIIVPIVKLAVSLPYNTNGRVAWMIFFLSLLIIAFYIVFGEITSMSLFGSTSKLLKLMLVTVCSLLIAVYFTRKSLRKLYTDSAEININV